MFIERWGLPDGYPADRIPEHVRSFAVCTLDCDYAEAVSMAGQLGWKPVTGSLPAVKHDTQGNPIENVWSLHLTVDGEPIPFMVKLTDRMPFSAYA